MTLAGQTAPPPGLSIINGEFQTRTHDVLVQHIRTRGGLIAARRMPLAIDAFPGNVYNIVMDHVSTAWSTDDLVTSWWGAHDITYSHVLATGELQNTGVWSDCDGKVMLNDSVDSRILMKDSALLTAYQRMPLAQANPFVFVNNIVYNWSGVGTQFQRQTGDAHQAGQTGGEFVIVGNHYKQGPLNASAWSPYPIMFQDNWVDDVHIYLDRNYAPDWAPSEQWDLVDNRLGDPLYTQATLQVFAPGAWPEGLVALDGSVIFDLVLDNAGAFPLDRDSLDAHLITDIRAGNGAMISSTTFPTLAENTRALTLPANPNDDDDGDGYTNLENWLHQYSADIEP